MKVPPTSTPTTRDTGLASAGNDSDRRPVTKPECDEIHRGKAGGRPDDACCRGPTEQGFARELLAIPGVTSIFLTADFVTVSKTSDVPWESIIPEATSILEGEFGS